MHEHAQANTTSNSRCRGGSNLQTNRTVRTSWQDIKGSFQGRTRNSTSLCSRRSTENFSTTSTAIGCIANCASQQPNPFVSIPIAGDHIQFEDLEFTFKVDEDFKNWIELFKWMNGLGYPEEHSEYKELAANPRWSGEGLVTDISVISTTNIKNPNIDIVFREATPISLSGFSYDTTSSSVEYVTATARFKYIKFDINSLPKA